jgi:hypothetical protein
MCLPASLIVYHQFYLIPQSRGFPPALPAQLITIAEEILLPPCNDQHRDGKINAYSITY